MSKKSAVIFFLISALAAVIIFGEYTETAVATGVAEPEGGYVSVVAEQSGTIIRLITEEGSSINANTALAEVAPQRLGADGNDFSKMTIEILRQQRDLILEKIKQVDSRLTQKKQWLSERLRMNDHQTDEARIGLKSLEPAVVQAKDMIERYRELEREGFVSHTVVSEKLSDFTTLQSRVLTATQQVQQLERQNVELRVESADFEQQANSDKLSFQMELEKTNQSIELAKFQSNSLVTAGVGGRVVVSSVRLGQYVNRGDSLFMVAPEGAKISVRLNVPAEATARLEVGQHVKLRYAAFPYQKYGIQTGNITSISGAPVQTDANGHERPAIRGFYRVIVHPDVQAIRQDGLDLPIPAGTPVDANIEIANEWIVDWVYSIFVRK
ncbi:HlyD family secretion protein [Pseudomonas sp. PA-3-6H]|uniref:HlyD family secretion protein n=1 Tax=Pseudomonas sp. PA-3-6H TaxID=2665475 RepID=UPI001F2F4A3B|nr:HlyD family efflux transporter periplasmic adaptor subunit [Pseudomonas sp. PA-3-6H]MCF5510575.1 HlyD family efflux transporter periplasmic adaptor subunit [Pseudomonas sp. PA-3-6H]